MTSLSMSSALTGDIRVRRKIAVFRDSDVDGFRVDDTGFAAERAARASIFINDRPQSIRPLQRTGNRQAWAQAPHSGPA